MSVWRTGRTIRNVGRLKNLLLFAFLDKGGRSFNVDKQEGGGELADVVNLNCFFFYNITIKC